MKAFESLPSGQNLRLFSRSFLQTATFPKHHSLWSSQHPGCQFTTFALCQWSGPGLAMNCHVAWWWATSLSSGFTPATLIGIWSPSWDFWLTTHSWVKLQTFLSSSIRAHLSPTYLHGLFSLHTSNCKLGTTLPLWVFRSVYLKILCWTARSSSSYFVAPPPLYKSP